MSVPLRQPAEEAQSESEGPVLRPTGLSRLRRVCRLIGIYILLPYLAVFVLAVIFQRSLMYSPGRMSITAAAEFAASRRTESLELEVEDQTVIRGWWLHADEEEPSSDNTASSDRSAPVVIYFPGNAGNRMMRWHDLAEFSAAGFDVVIFDYRGYGDSDGTPREPALEADAREVWRFVTETRGIPPERIVVFGESLGGAVSVSLLSSLSGARHPAALLMNSTFSSMPDTVAALYPVFPFRWFVYDTWPSIDRIPNIQCDVRVFHGSADSLVPVSHARRLAAACPRAEFIESTGLGHNDLPAYRLREVLNRLRDAIESDTEQSDTEQSGA